MPKNTQKKETASETEKAIVEASKGEDTVELSEQPSAGIGDNSGMTDYGPVTYSPTARTNEALKAEAFSAEKSLLTFGNTGALSMTSILATLAADTLVMGCEELRSKIGGVEKLQGDYVFYLEGVASENPNATEPTVDVYRQLRPAIVGLLGEAAKDNTVKSLLPGALRKAVLLGKGFAQFAYFERSRNGRINRTDRGRLFPASEKFDETKWARGIAVSMGVICPMEFAVMQKPEREGGGTERLATQPEGYPKIHKPGDDPLFFLSDEVAEGLYGLHVLGLPQERIDYDPVGYVQGLKPVKRDTQGTQATPVATNANGTTVVKVEQPKELAERIKNAHIASGKPETTTGAVLNAFVELLEDANAHVDIEYYMGVLHAAHLAVLSVSERYTTAESITKNDRARDMLEYIAGLAETCRDVVRWDAGQTVLEYRPAGADKSGPIKFDYSDHKNKKTKARA